MFSRNLPLEQPREIFIFEVLTLRARSSKSLIICLYMKTIRAKQAQRRRSVLKHGGAHRTQSQAHTSSI